MGEIQERFALAILGELSGEILGVMHRPFPKLCLRKLRTLIKLVMEFYFAYFLEESLQAFLNESVVEFTKEYEEIL